MEVKVLAQNENHLQMKISVTNYNSPYEIKTSSDYVINKTALLQMKIVVLQEQTGHINKYHNLFLVRFVKLMDYYNKNMMCRLAIICPDIGVQTLLKADDEGTWHLMKEFEGQQYKFDFHAQMKTFFFYGPFASLHEDTELTDFELRCEDGSVAVHGAVLAAHSPVFRRMLGGSWKETKERFIELPRTSILTLQHFKDYLYLQTLPNEGLEQLLLLASCYMMSGLEQRCKAKLMSLNATIDYGLIKFATKHKYNTRASRILTTGIILGMVE